MTLRLLQKTLGQTRCLSKKGSVVLHLVAAFVLLVLIAWKIWILAFGDVSTITNPPAASSFKSNNEFADLARIRSSDLVFVGGSSRSGTTLMRAILDVHSRIRCGAETKIVRDLLKSRIFSPTNEWRTKTQIDSEAVDDSMALFIHNIIINNGPRAPRLCMKDPDAFGYIDYLHRLFPRAKFLYMIRDGRAVTYSIMTHRGASFNRNSYQRWLAQWNSFNQDVNQQCQSLGPKICMRVKYEDLVLDNKHTVRRVVDFLGENFEPRMLEHEKYVGSEIFIANNTWSGAQVERPLYTDSLTSWADKIPYFSPSETENIAPMLVKFNYNLTFETSVIEKQQANIK